MLRTLIEEKEAFGAPPPGDQLDSAIDMLLAGGIWWPQPGALSHSHEEAEEVAHSSYAAALTLGMDIASALSSEDPDALPQALRNFFHAAARIGEARMLARIARRLDEICTGRPGVA